MSRQSTRVLKGESIGAIAKRLGPGLAPKDLAVFANVLAHTNGYPGVGGTIYPGQDFTWYTEDIPATAPPPTDPPPVVEPPVVVPPVVAPPATGVRPFSASSPFNTPTPSTVKWGAVVPAATGTDNGKPHWYLNGDAAVRVNAKDSDPTWTYKMPSFIDANSHRNRPSKTFSVKAPTNLSAGSDSDHILVLVQPDGSYVETWLTSVNQSTMTVTATAWATGNVVSGQGVGDNTNNAGVRAANFSWLAGLITAADIAAGKIDHALVVAVQDTLSISQYVAPATAPEGSHGAGNVPMGTRFGIPSGTAKPAGLSPVGSMIFDALVQYGAFVGDWVGGGMYPIIYSEPGAITGKQSDSLIAFWNSGGCDFDRLAPLIRQAA